MIPQLIEISAWFPREVIMKHTVSPIYSYSYMVAGFTGLTG